MLERIMDYFGMAQKQGKWKIVKDCSQCSFWNSKKCVLKNSKRTKVCEDYCEQ